MSLMRLFNAASPERVWRPG